MSTPPDPQPEPAPGEVPPQERATRTRKTTPLIRGLRAMAIVRWMLLGLVTLLAVTTVWKFWGPSEPTRSARVEDHFYCPMHPQIRSPTPGECPICHMNLEPIPAERRSGPSATNASAVASETPHQVVPVSMATDKQQAIGVVTSEIKLDSLGGSLRVPGVVSAPETGLSQVRVRAAGFVEKVAVKQTGVRVARGQTLAWIYSPEIYRAQEEFLAARRWNTAPSPSSAPSSNAGDMASAARRALELLGLENVDIEEITRTGSPMRAIPVRAPGPGYVTRFNAVLGVRADPETILYELADLATVWVVASVHERDIGSIHAGKMARFYVSGSATEPLEARIDLVEPELEESTRTSRVRLSLKNRNFTLRPGQFGEVTFDLPAARGLFAPRDAVIHTGEQQYVYVQSAPDRFEPRVVRTGIEVNSRIQILEGLSAGMRVVTRGSFMLDSESRLQASLAATPASATTPKPDSAVTEQDASCGDAFDRLRFPDKYTKCLACERQHAGMDSMVDACKAAIARPWR